MILELSKIADTDYRFVVVPSEKLSSKPSEVDQIKCGDMVYDVSQYYEYRRGELFPGTMFLMATGQILTEQQVWQGFPGSDRIFFFVCIEGEAQKIEAPTPKTEDFDRPPRLID